MPAQLPVSYRAVFSDHTRLDSLTIKEHTTCINIYIQTYFITDITFEDTVMPCSFLAGYPAAIYNHLRAHHALCLSYWSSYSFNLSALAQFTVQTQHSWQMHEEPTLFLLLWVGERRAFPCKFLAPLPGAFSGIFRSTLPIGYRHAVAFSGAASVWGHSERHPLISFSKPAQSRAA